MQVYGDAFIDEAPLLIISNYHVSQYVYMQAKVLMHNVHMLYKWAP